MSLIFFFTTLPGHDLSSSSLLPLIIAIECIIAKDGQQALELLNNNLHYLPDIVFLDLKMPRFNGKKFLFEVKKDERLKRIPIVIYTTSREVTESKELKEMGAVYFITKPSNADEIYYLISFVLNEQWSILQNNK